MSSATLSIFRHLFASVAEEMGVTLGRAAYSPNIKERLDFSCALFLGDGRMLAQAAHIPVHLGAMPASVQAAIDRCAPFNPGDVIILNDPYLGGTHLPDVTLVSPVFMDDESARGPHFFVASRAHHADIGGMSPGSMPLSTELYQEGVIIPPIKIVEAGQRNTAVWDLIMRNVRTPIERQGDLTAQLAAHATGQKRLLEIVGRYGLNETLTQAEFLITYAARMTRAAIQQMPDGIYHFQDYLDNDGQSDDPIPIKVAITIQDDQITADFTGTAPAVSGNLNAVPAIVESAVAYCLRCLALALLETALPMNQGAFESLEIIIESGSLLNPHPPHAVAAGNVETSQRIVDVVFGALAQALPNLVPAASQGTMNNLTFGGTMKSSQEGHPDQPFAYYETIGGGAGAGAAGNGGNGIHVHMSNTRNTPVEAMEYTFPLRIVEYALRHNSGGNGHHNGGDGLIRTIQFLNPATVTLVSERRTTAPYGLNGAESGQNGRNTLIHNNQPTLLPGKITLKIQPNDQIRIETPGGGGWNKPTKYQKV
jgi:N-methylhydantoinase B